MPDDADDARAHEAEARLFARYLVGRPPPQVINRLRPDNGRLTRIDARCGARVSRARRENVAGHEGRHPLGVGWHSSSLCGSSGGAPSGV